MLVLTIFTKPERHPFGNRGWRLFRTKQQRLTYHLGETLRSLAIDVLKEHSLYDPHLDEGDCLLVQSMLSPKFYNMPPIWVTMTLWPTQTDWLLASAPELCEHFAKGVNAEILGWSGRFQLSPCTARVDVQFGGGCSVIINHEGVITGRR